jgi:hypothetical protein
MKTYGGWGYGRTLSLTSALDGVGSQRHTPAAVPPGTKPDTHCIGGPQGRCGRVRKISPPPGFDPRTVQSVASCCTHLKPGNRWRRMVSLTFPPLYPWVLGPRYPPNIRLGGPHGRSGCCKTPREEKLPIQLIVKKSATKVTKRCWMEVACNEHPRDCRV